MLMIIPWLLLKIILLREGWVVLKWSGHPIHHTHHGLSLDRALHLNWDFFFRVLSRCNSHHHTIWQFKEYNSVASGVTITTMDFRIFPPPPKKTHIPQASPHIAPFSPTLGNPSSASCVWGLPMSLSMTPSRPTRDRDKMYSPQLWHQELCVELERKH